jgi:hypothetical protein
MAKKDDGYNDALGSIFDVIFSQSQKSRPPKPRRLSGMPGGSEQFANALAELAANPMYHVSNPMMNSINDGLFNNMTIIDVRTDMQRAGGSKYKYSNSDDSVQLRIRVGDLPKLMSNPNKFIDKAFDGAKDERKWTNIVAAAAAMDGALAAYAGWRQGMDIGDAKQFGMAAMAHDDDDTKDAARRAIAQNAAMEREIKLARDAVKSANPGISENSQAFADAMRSELAGRKSAVQKKGEALYQAMNGSSGLRAQSFTGAEADRRRVMRMKDSTTEEKQAKDLAQKQLQDLENDLRSQLRGKVPDSEIDELVKQLNHEVDGQIGVGLSAYRINYAKQQRLKQLYTTDPNEIKKLAGAQNFAMMWERTKGSGERAGEGIKIGIKEIDMEIKRAKGTMSDAQFKVYKEDLLKRKAKLELLSNQYSSLGMSKGGVGGVKPWEEPNTSYGFQGEAFYGRKGSKIANEGLQEQMGFQIAKLEQMHREAVASGDMFEIQRFESELSHLKTMQKGTARIPGSELRLRADKLQAWIRNNPLSPGTASAMLAGYGFFATPYAPGAQVSRKFLTREKDKDGNYITRSEKLILRNHNMHPVISNFYAAYYFTPGSLMKTVLNGEGIKYLAYRSQDKTMGMVHGNDKLMEFLKSRGSGSAYADFFDADGNLDKVKVTKNFNQLLDLLEADGNLPKDIAKFAKTLEGRMSRFNGLLKITDYSPQALLMKALKVEQISKYLTGKQTKWLLKMFKNNSEWKAAVEAFIGKSIGIKQLLKTGVKLTIQAIFQAIGLATTGGLINGVVWVVTEGLFLLAKPAMKFALFMLMGFCGFLALIYFTISTFFTPTAVAHNAIVPGEVVSCGIGLAPIPGDPGPNPGGKPIDSTPPANAICPISVGTTCNQGPTGHWSHAKMGTFSIDTARNSGAWKAPNPGTVIEALYNQECEWERGKSRGGQVRFKDDVTGTVYRLLHADAVVSQGTKVNQGDIVAVMNMNLPSSKCWNGAHYHLDVLDGGWVNSEQWYNDLGCNLSSCPN